MLINSIHSHSAGPRSTAPPGEPPPSPPASDPVAARAKIDSALKLLQETRGENFELQDIYTEADSRISGEKSHIASIKFDRGTRDVSQHGNALREKADGATRTLGSGLDEYEVVVGNTARLKDLVSGARADLAGTHTKADWNLKEALNDFLFVEEQTVRGLNMSLNRSRHLLGKELDPYITEVEEDAPGRDVGRFADDIEELWALAHRQLGAGPVYSRSAERSFAGAEKYLLRARDSLFR